MRSLSYARQLTNVSGLSTQRGRLLRPLRNTLPVAGEVAVQAVAERLGRAGRRGVQVQLIRRVGGHVFGDGIAAPVLLVLRLPIASQSKARLRSMNSLPQAASPCLHTSRPTSPLHSPLA